MRRPSVDFPEPDSPTSPSVSPAAISMLTFVTALTVRRPPPNTPAAPAANSFVTLSVRTSASATATEFCAALDTDTGDLMIGPLLLQRRIYLGAIGNRHRTPRMKSAPRRRIERARNSACDRLQAPPPDALDAGNRFEQAARVGIERILKQRIARRLLHHPRGVKNRDRIGIFGDDSEIVRDEDDREF